MAGPGQRDHYTARRAEIWESLYPAEPTRDYSLPSADDGVEQVEQFVPPVAKHGHAQPKGFAASTAEVTGENVRQIQRSLARGQGPSDTAHNPRHAGAGNPGQRANHISRRGEICEALAPYVPVEFQDGEDDMGGNEISTHHETDALGRKKSPQQTKSFAAETAKLTGESKQSINQYRAIGDALGEDALRVGGTSLDKKSELTALAKMQPEQRAPLIARAIAGEKVTARAPAITGPATYPT